MFRPQVTIECKYFGIENRASSSKRTCLSFSKYFVVYSNRSTLSTHFRGLYIKNKSFTFKVKLICTVKFSLPFNLGTNDFTCLPKHGAHWYRSFATSNEWIWLSMEICLNHQSWDCKSRGFVAECSLILLVQRRSALVKLSYDCNRLHTVQCNKKYVG